ncbi:MAG: rubrerythrin family protein [Anaerolineaceae bacterium]|nr:rubrerythrin family protein [Anaerolineaceae bacterium]
MNKFEDWKKFYLDEWNSSLLYDTMAELEKDKRLAEVYRRIAATEIKHANVWETKLIEANQPVPDFKPSWQTKILIWLSKRFGPAMILSNIHAMEQAGSAGYQAVPGMGDMKAAEDSHAFLVTQITSSVRGGIEGGVLAQLEGRHRSAGGNALRAAVLGANDGLVSNLSLVMGVAGAAVGNRAILINGLAGMLAGAISMALGEWLSVQSSRELFSHQIEVEKEEIENAPEEEAEELALIYEARGLKPEQARILADQILENKESYVLTLAKEELGIDPQELGGSAWEAALTSFVLFTIGAIIPVIPFTFLSGMTAVFISIGLSVVGLFGLGATITLFTGKPVLFSGMRMVIFGLIAAAVTFGIGSLIGNSIAG